MEIQFNDTEHKNHRVNEGVPGRPLLPFRKGTKKSQCQEPPQTRSANMEISTPTTMRMKIHLLILNISLGILFTNAQGLREKNTTRRVEIVFTRSLDVGVEFGHLRLRFINNRSLSFKLNNLKNRKKMPNSKTSDMQRARNLEPEYYAELNSGISETIQDQSMTLEEILTRFKRGQSLPIGREVYYDGTEDEVMELDPDPTLDGSFDLVDADLLKDQISEAKAQRQSANDAKRRSAESRGTKPKAVTEGTEVEAQGEGSEAGNAEVQGEQQTLF